MEETLGNDDLGGECSNNRGSNMCEVNSDFVLVMVNLSQMVYNYYE